MIKQILIMSVFTCACLGLAAYKQLQVCPEEWRKSIQNCYLNEPNPVCVIKDGKMNITAFHRCHACYTLEADFTIDGSCEDQGFHDDIEFCTPQDKQKKCGIVENASCGWKISDKSADKAVNAESRCEACKQKDVLYTTSGSCPSYTQKKYPIFKNVQLVNNSTGNALAFRSKLKYGKVFVAIDADDVENEVEDTLFDIIPLSEDQETQEGAYSIKHVKSGLCLQVESDQRSRRLVFGDCADQLIPFGLVMFGKEWVFGEYREDVFEMKAFAGLIQNTYFYVQDEKVASARVERAAVFRMVKRD